MGSAKVEGCCSLASRSKVFVLFFVVIVATAAVLAISVERGLEHSGEEGGIYPHPSD